MSSSFAMIGKYSAVTWMVFFFFFFLQDSNLEAWGPVAKALKFPKICGICLLLKYQFTYMGRHQHVSFFFKVIRTHITIHVDGPSQFSYREVVWVSGPAASMETVAKCFKAARQKLRHATSICGRCVGLAVACRLMLCRLKIRSANCRSHQKKPRGIWWVRGFKMVSASLRKNQTKFADLIPQFW